MRRGGEPLRDIPWRAYFREVCGKIGWPPGEFWDASLPEIWDAIDGFAEYHAGRKAEEDGAPTQAELDEAMKDGAD